MRIGLRGPEGVQNRIAELQSRIADKLGTAGSPDATSDPPAGQVRSRGLSGGLRPFDPFGFGASPRAISSPTHLKSLIESAALREGLDPDLLDSLVAAESGYDPAARSRAGALGLTQLMPSTATALGVAQPFDPEQNLSGGAKYLSQMLQKFGSLEKALAAYNAGPGAVERHGGIPPYAETQAYVRRVMSLYNAKKERP
ncbi:MAG: hypothetical protein BroJett009_04740 [Armatimonadota bacterium]|nr:MAG: hypothetical protein BroJett009_04740 [Armatimonadota bacterium]